uniref:Mitochondrial carrier protein n=1 Tax=Timspurckia oligopyrenoides TaxID=708627 RepID=A0A7S1EQH2_9RHOD|mmetsp:Transcript_11896/g.21524  ORF Transcript_11896/g.21524 Transcript_11896/m.21524 type:complete len:346 (+) Transcript_11896:116-1153(+)
MNTSARTEPQATGLSSRGGSNQWLSWETNFSTQFKFWSREIMIGALSGGLGTIVGHPLDTVRIRMQNRSVPTPIPMYLNHSPYHSTNAPLICIPSNAHSHYSKAIESNTNLNSSTLRSQTIRSSILSIRSLFRGIGAPLLATPLLTATQFSTYQFCSRILQSATHPPEARTVAIISGATAGFMQCFISTPTELAKIRVQSSSLYRGVFDCLRKTCAQEGWQALFRGFGVNAARRVPAFGVYFFSYEEMKKIPQVHTYGLAGTAVIGGLAGVIGWLSTYPLDVIKSRIQNDAAGKFTSTLHCIRYSVQTDGIAFLYRGLTATLIRAFGMHAVIFMTYESARKHFVQ